MLSLFSLVVYPRGKRGGAEDEAKSNRVSTNFRKPTLETMERIREVAQGLKEMTWGSQTPSRFLMPYTLFNSCVCTFVGICDRGRMLVLLQGR